MRQKCFHIRLCTYDMGRNDMTHCGADSAIDDIAYLTRSEHRLPTLVALADRPRSRPELCELTEMSSATIGRTLDEFKTRRWVQKAGHNLQATFLGERIASWTEELLRRVETEHKLRDIYHQLPREVIEFALEMRSTVTVNEADAPYRALNRYRSLLHESTQYRFVGFDAGLYEACKDEFQQRILNGLEAELIDSPSVARYMCTTYPERCAELLEHENMTAYVQEDVPPYGVCLFDSRIAICVYHSDSAGVMAVIDTDAPEARSWAESVYASYKADARLVEPQSIIA